MVLNFLEYLESNNTQKYFTIHKRIYNKSRETYETRETCAAHKAAHNAPLSLEYSNSSNYIVMRDEITHNYYASEDIYQAYELYESYAQYCRDNNTHPHMHEVVNPKAIQCVYFDIDLKISEYLELGDTSDAETFARLVIDSIKDVVCEFIEDIREANFDEERIIDSETYFDELLISQNDIYGHSTLQPDNTLFKLFSSSSHQKISYHLMTPIFCKNQKIAKFAFTTIRERVLDSLFENTENLQRSFLENVVDGNMSKPWSNLRMWASSKSTDPNRVKEIIEPDIYTKGIDLPFEESLIGWYNHDKRPPIYIHDIDGADVENFVLNDSKLTNGEEQGKIEELLQKSSYFPDFNNVWNFRNETNGVFWYQRMKPSMCPQCNEIHHKDNTLFVTIGPSKSKPVYINCAQKKGAKIKIGNLESIDSEEYQNTQIQNAIKQSALKIPQSYELLSWFKDKNIEHQIITSDVPSIDIQQFEKHISIDGSTLVIKANMKMGKTGALINLMKQMVLNKSLPSNPKILIIGFRQTFTQSLLSRLNQELDNDLLFQSYQDIPSHNIWLDMYPRCIIQVDSLNRIQPGELKPDLIILDEVESILSQFSSPLIRDLNKSYAIFEWLMRASPRCIYMDANISLRTLNMLKIWRTTKNMILYQNIYANATGDKFYILRDSQYLITIMIDKLRSNQRIVICANSLNEARIYKQALSYAFKLIDITNVNYDPALYDPYNFQEGTSDISDISDISTMSDTPDTPDTKRIAVYTSDTSPTVKDEHFKNVDKYWSDIDILIYTPTVSAGISYEKKHFDCLFAYFTDTSCDVETARQMMGRVRDLKNKEYYITVSAKKSYLPTDPIRVTRYLIYIRQNLNKIGLTNHEYPPLNIEYDPDTGDMKYQKLNFFDLWVANICYKNESRNDYLGLLIKQIRETGASIEFAAKIPMNNQDITIPTRSNLSDDANVARGKELVECDKLNDEQYELVQNALSCKSQNNPISITQKIKNSYVKTFICNWYSLPDNSLLNENDYHLAAFLENPRFMKIYKNLCDIKSLICLNGMDPPPYTLENILKSMTNTEIRKRNNLSSTKTYIKDIAVDNKSIKHSETWKILYFLGYKFIGQRITISDGDMKNCLHKFARMSTDSIQILALTFGIRAIPFIPMKDNSITEYYRNKILIFVREIIYNMYGLSIIKKKYKQDINWIISHNPTLTELAVVEDKKHNPDIIDMSNIIIY